MELNKLGDKTYYINNNTNIGIYKIDEDNVYIIDSGLDDSVGKKILNLLTSKGLNIKGIINTHSNADHIGGNKYIQDKTGCVIYGNKIENELIKYPILETSFLYGGKPLKELKNKFLYACESKSIDIENMNIEGLEYFDLKGHFFNMIGIKTSDDVYFIADSLVSEYTINKYHVFFIYDVYEYLKTLDYLEGIDGKIFIASHCEKTSNIKDLIKINRDKIYEILDYLYGLLESDMIFEDILKNIFDHYELKMDIIQYNLVGSTIKSYLTYLYENNKIEYSFINNKLYWKRK